VEQTRRKTARKSTLRLMTSARQETTYLRTPLSALLFDAVVGLLGTRDDGNNTNIVL
jgi:hypothetical protein